MFGINIKKKSQIVKTWPSRPCPSQSCTLRTCLNPVIPPQPFHFLPFPSSIQSSPCADARCIKTHHHQSHLTSFTRPSLGSLPLQFVDPHYCLCVSFSRPELCLALHYPLLYLAHLAHLPAVLCISLLGLRLDMCRCAKAASGRGWLTRLPEAHPIPHLGAPFTFSCNSTHPR